MTLSAQRTADSASTNLTAATSRAGYGRFIGRVGALALFLGVGTALAVPAVASADTADSGSSSASASASASAESSASDDDSSDPAAGNDTAAADEGEVADDDTEETEPQKDSAESTDVDDEEIEDVVEDEESVDAEDLDDEDVGVDDVEDVAEGDRVTIDDEPAVVVDIDIETDNEPEVASSERTDVSETPAIAGVVSVLLTSILNPQGDTAPAQSPAQAATAAFARREGLANSEEAGVGAAVASVNTVAAQSLQPDQAALPPAPFMPYTTAAIKNAMAMVLSHPFKVLARPITAAVFVVRSVVDGLLTDLGVVPALPYATSGWVTLHGDPANRKLQPGVDLSADYNKWSALQGAGILAAPTILPNGNVVVTTGVAAGGSNLHVIDRDGNVVWQAAPWDGQEGVDSGAVLSSPIIDRTGNIYVSDGDQVWSFTDAGEVRWVTALPEAPANDQLKPGSRNINPFITATLTHDGSVLGVTVYGQVVVLDGTTGVSTAPVFQIPGPLAARAATDAPPTLWAGGFMDPEIIDPIWQVAFGGLYRTTNTPGVDAKTGRIFVAATDIEAGRGALYGIDYVPATPFSQGKVTVAFATQMGPGSGSSPTVSADGRVVYASDDSGLLYAFSTRTGKQIWAAESNAEAASVAVDRSGNVYLLTRNDVMSSFDASGNRRWVADVSELTAELLPVSPILGAPIAIGGGNPTVVNGRVVQAVVYGYNFVAQGRTVFVPVKATLVEFDPETGRGLRNLVDTNEGTEGILNIAPDGRMYASLGAITTTSVAPLAPIINTLLPAGLTVLTPSGGFNGFTPIVV